MKPQPTVMAKALAEFMLKYEPEPIPVPEVSEATMVDFELADLLGAPARPASFPDAETPFWINCQVELDLAFME